VRSTVLPPGGTVIDMFTQEAVGVVDDLHAVVIRDAGAAAARYLIFFRVRCESIRASPGVRARRSTTNAS
jgi:hypothetical protein